jgi:hypothetical protein
VCFATFYECQVCSSRLDLETSVPTFSFILPSVTASGHVLVRSFGFDIFALMRN